MQIFIVRAHVSYECDMCEHVFFSIEKAKELFEASLKSEHCAKCGHGYDELTVYGPYSEGDDIQDDIGKIIDDDISVRALTRRQELILSSSRS
jgi:rubredoxin